MKAFSTAATGMSAQQMMIDIVANNLANVNTSGFKRSQIDFQDLLYDNLRKAGSEIMPGVKSPTGIEVGSGVRAAGVVKVYTPGELENTGNPLNVAISGDGFLQFTGFGNTYYSRDGGLLVGADGNLVNSSGYVLDPPISIPNNAENVTIGTDGSVNVTINGQTSSIGQIQLVRFANPSGLEAVGDNLLRETAASGTPLTGLAGQDGFGKLINGFLEKSNVQMITELVNLITAQRAYEVNSHAIKAGDEMLKTANQMGR